MELMWITIALCFVSVYFAHKIRENAISQLSDDKRSSARDIRVLMTNSVCIYACVAFPAAFAIRKSWPDPRWLATVIQIAVTVILLGIWHATLKRKLVTLELPDAAVHELVRSHGLYAIGAALIVVGSFL